MTISSDRVRNAEAAEIEAFFAAADNWRAELEKLRSIVLDCGLVEELKWHAPIYTFEGGNVAAVGGFKQHCVLSFFKGVLLPDPAGILVAPGRNTRSARMVTFTELAQIEALEPTLRQYLAQAIENERAGLKVDFGTDDDLATPEELIGRLERDPELDEAWHSLTPGRRRGWLLHFTQAKQSKTRLARIDKAAPKILAGKGMHDR